MNKGLFTLKELSEYLSMGESTIARDVRNGTFPDPVWVGSNKYWRKTDVDTWIDGLSTRKSEPKKETRGRKRLAA
jgi:predicted DNA-binding transcriptional regulator AlpA